MKHLNASLSKKDWIKQNVLNDEQSDTDLRSCLRVRESFEVQFQRIRGLLHSWPNLKYYYKI